MTALGSVARRAMWWTAVGAVALAGCNGRRGAAPPGPVASALVAFAAEAGATPAETVAAWRELDAVAERIQRRRQQGPGDWIDAFNAVVFDELGYEREIESRELRFFRLPTVLAARRGSCLGLGALYLALAERLGVGLDGVMVPGHFFVRTRGPAVRNVELLRRGEAMPDAWYRGKYGPWPTGGGESEYFRPLTPSELAAVHWFNAGNDLRARHEVRRASAAYAHAVAAWPSFAEAQASLGAIHQLEGSLAEAESAYADAARARPDLPGLAQNLALLRREQQPTVMPDATPATPPSSDRRPR